MGREFATLSLFLYLLLVCACGYAAREVPVDDDVLRLHSMDDDDSHQVNHDTKFFFKLKDLKVGNKIPIYLPEINLQKLPPLLTKEEAESIPFSSKQLPQILQLFSISQGSPQAKAMEEALGMCESKPMKIETKFCATSLESMLDFLRSIFGSESFRVVTTSHHTKPSKTPVQNYTVLEKPEEIPASPMAACHPLSYPYLVYACHSLKSENKVLKISLGGEKEDRVKAVVACHMNTSGWNADHPAFRQLKAMPGTSEICHFFPADHLACVPANR